MNPGFGPLEGNHKKRFIRLIPAFPAEHQQETVFCKDWNFSKDSPRISSATPFLILSDNRTQHPPNVGALQKWYITSLAC